MIGDNIIEFYSTVTEINGEIPLISFNYNNSLNNYIIDYSELDEKIGLLI